MQGLQLICFDSVIVSLKYSIFGMKLQESRIIATEKHGKTRKERTSFRAGCVSDGINIRFGKGPFGTVSELAELADISCARAKDNARGIKAKNGTPHTRS